MKMLFKQRFFSWLDSYDIYDQNGNTIFKVEGKVSFGHKLHILNSSGVHIGTVKEVVLTFLPKFEMYENGRCIGQISKEFSFFKPRFRIDCKGYQVSGDFMGWDYKVNDSYGAEVATISKELFNFTDTYSIDLYNPADALYILMLVLAIDAEKCSSN